MSESILYMKPFNQYIRFFMVGAIVSMSLTAVFAQPGTILASRQREEHPMTVLFLIFDDMRAELNIYGSQMARTPNLDQLARQGVCFDRAYCQCPLCCPSLSSLLPGHCPTSSGLYRNRKWFGATYPDWVSLPKYFRMNGYETLRTGKVFHGGIDDIEAWIEGGEKWLYTNPVNTNSSSALSDKELLSYVRKRTLKLTTGAGVNPRSDYWEAVEGDAAKQLGDTKVPFFPIRLMI